MRKISSLLAVLAITASTQGLAQDTAANKAFRVDTEASWLRVLAYPDGPLKRFGHHHVISHHGFSGSVEVAANPLESSFRLELNVADFVVDDADMRALEGEDFEDEVPQDDIDGEDLEKGEQPFLRLREEGFALLQDGFPGQVVDIVAPVTVFRKVRRFSQQFPASRQHRAGEQLDLPAGIVDVELLFDFVADGTKHAGENVPDGRTSSVPEMEGARGVGADKLHLNPFALPQIAAPVSISQKEYAAQRLEPLLPSD